MHIDHSRLSAWGKVVVDTSSLMESGEAFVELLPVFRQAGVKLTIPATVRQEVVKHLHGSDAARRCKASHANEVIRCFDEEGLADLGIRDGRKTHADHEILTTVMEGRKDHDFLVLTNDRDLAANIMQMGGFGSVKSSRKLDVAELAADGRFEPWLLKPCGKCGNPAATTQARLDKHGKCLCGDCIKEIRAAKEAQAADPLKDYLSGYGSKSGPQASGNHSADSAGKAEGRSEDRRKPSGAEAGKDGVDWVKAGAVGAVVVVGGLVWAWWEGLFD